ncbi:type VI secretion system baseplate subunit TssG [Dechloromonas denitrificans]|uniref:type VI secretion system baseplate subunit TssG n=1 Tax=Dechloromonas denitrificans TaxID=281362 RepID=UPI001CF8C354|nr:type VI secretion system baseplate subunit TssG [Dechloromonas denitrificans]UCV02001.1 type VI secretion system baseplate subunit TssG [Dechloromonas denitrificans]UCV06336.1 type VI secretion system baseplate subunit TssG [Dechloromonas denitrificans]
MRTPQRRVDPGIVEHSLQEPERYEFFQLVRLYEMVFKKEARAFGGDAVSERIRFRNSLRLGFAPSQVDAMQPRYRRDAAGLETAELEQVEITPSFMGMLGVNGTLPIHYTEQVIHHERFKRDASGRAFLDLFTNRAVGHFYRAWKKYKLPVQYETDRRNRFLPLVLSLAGLGFDALRERMSTAPGAINDESVAFFAGLLRQRPVSAETLEKALGGYFREKVVVEQFVGRWYVVPIEQRSTLGGKNAVLGSNTLVGERVWQRNLRIRIHIGPLTHERYMAFLPKGEMAAGLEKILTLATGGQFEYEIRPILRAADVKPLALGKGQGGRLGYDTFMLTRPAKSDRSDTSYLTHFIN